MAREAACIFASHRFKRFREPIIALLKLAQTGDRILEETMMDLTRRAALGALALAASLGLAGPAAAQTTLKWAHVYEASEPDHQWALWPGEEFKKRTNGKYAIEGFAASSLGKESDINEGLSLGTVDIIYTGQLFAGRAYGPLAIGGAPYMFRDFAHWNAFR